MTISSPATLPLVRFRAGALQLGMVASAATRLGEVEPGCPHIGTLLGLPVDCEPAERRTVTVEAYGKKTCIIVDGPVRITSIGMKDLLPTSRLLRRERTRTILGFGREGAHIVLGKGHGSMAVVPGIYALPATAAGGHQ